MSRKNERDYTYLIWKDVETRTQYTIGELSKNGKYEFRYIDEINEAIKRGFKPFISMEHIDKIYCSDELFPIFSSRLPESNRKDITKILEKYNLKEYNAFELLKRSGTKLPIDTLEFIEPIFDDEKSFTRNFWLAGVRYYLDCNKNNCANVTDISIDDPLTLVPEPDCEQDSNAIAVYNSHKKIGYIPRYFNKAILKRLTYENASYELVIKEFNKSNKCNECIKVTLRM